MRRKENDEVLTKDGETLTIISIRPDGLYLAEDLNGHTIEVHDNDLEENQDNNVSCESIFHAINTITMRKGTIEIPQSDSLNLTYLLMQIENGIKLSELKNFNINLDLDIVQSLREIGYD